MIIVGISVMMKCSNNAKYIPIHCEYSQVIEILSMSHHLNRCKIVKLNSVIMMHSSEQKSSFFFKVFISNDTNLKVDVSFYPWIKPYFAMNERTRICQKVCITRWSLCNTKLRTHNSAPRAPRCNAECQPMQSSEFSQLTQTTRNTLIINVEHRC